MVDVFSTSSQLCVECEVCGAAPSTTICVDHRKDRDEEEKDIEERAG